MSCCNSAVNDVTALKYAFRLFNTILPMAFTYYQMLKQRGERNIPRKLLLCLIFPISAAIQTIINLTIVATATVRVAGYGRRWCPIALGASPSTARGTAKSEAWQTLCILIGRLPEEKVIFVEEDAELTRIFNNCIMSNSSVESLEAKYQLRQKFAKMPVRLRPVSDKQFEQRRIPLRQHIANAFSAQHFATVTAGYLLYQSVSEAIIFGRLWTAEGLGLGIDMVVAQFACAAFCVGVETFFHLLLEPKYPSTVPPNAWYGSYRRATIWHVIGDLTERVWYGRRSRAKQWKDSVDSSVFLFVGWLLTMGTAITFLASVIGKPLESLEPNGLMIQTTPRTPYASNLGFTKPKDLPALTPIDSRLSPKMSTQNCRRLYNSIILNRETEIDLQIATASLSLFDGHCFSSNSSAPNSLAKACENPTLAITEGWFPTHVFGLTGQNAACVLAPCWKVRAVERWGRDQPSLKSGFSNLREYMDDDAGILLSPVKEMPFHVSSKRLKEAQEQLLKNAVWANRILIGQVIWSFIWISITYYQGLFSKWDCWRIPDERIGQFSLIHGTYELFIFSAWDTIEINESSWIGLLIEFINWYANIMNRDLIITGSLRYASTCPQLWRDAWGTDYLKRF